MPEGENTVAAELIEIPFEDWEAVDRLEGYPRLYDRLLFPAKLEDGTEVSSWVYVMHNLPEMAQVIESGTSKNTWDTGTTTAPTPDSMAEWSCHISKTQMVKKIEIFLFIKYQIFTSKKQLENGLKRQDSIPKSQKILLM